MKSYDVIVRRHRMIQESYKLEIQAANADAAEKSAIEACEDLHEDKWMCDDHDIVDMEAFAEESNDE